MNVPICSKTSIQGHFVQHDVSMGDSTPIFGFESFDMTWRFSVLSRIRERSNCKAYKMGHERSNDISHYYLRRETREHIFR